MGFAKAAGNHACSLIADATAKKYGCSQVLWLDGVERKYIEEVGSMNILFVIDGKLVTPSLDGSILAGITRDSILKLASSMGIPVEERKISIQEVAEAHAKGTLSRYSAPVPPPLSPLWVPSSGRARNIPSGMAASVPSPRSYTMSSPVFSTV